MNRAKYIIFTQPNGSYFATAFSATVNHKDVAHVYKQLNYKVESAGILTFGISEKGEVKPNCIPGSETLGIPLNMDKAGNDNMIMSIFLVKND